MQSFSRYVAAVAIAASLLFSAPAGAQDSEQPPESRRCDEEIFQCVTVDGTDTLVVVDINLAQLRAALEEAEDQVWDLTLERNELRGQRTGAWFIAGVLAVTAAVLGSILVALVSIRGEDE